MKLGKIINGIITLVEVENGREVEGVRTDAELTADGYKPACENPDGGEWVEYPTCLVQVYEPEPSPEPEPKPSFTAEDALEIILGGE